VLPVFELLKPASLEEAIEMLSEHPDSMPISGGTNLVVDMRSGKLSPKTLIDISQLGELCCIHEREGILEIGAGVRIADFLEDPMIARDVPILAEMARSFANTLIRNRATVGGNLVNAAPCSDTAPALLVLDAEVDLQSMVGTRRMPLAEFLVGAFQTRRQANEILTGVRLPIPPKEVRTAFEKMGLRKISCMAKVDVAVSVHVGEDGGVTNARVAVGAASAAALRVVPAEEALVGAPLCADTIRRAADLAARAAEPRAGSEYKRQVVRGMARRLLTSLAEGGRA